MKTSKIFRRTFENTVRPPNQKLLKRSMEAQTVTQNVIIQYEPIGLKDHSLQLWCEKTAKMTVWCIHIDHFRGFPMTARKFLLPSSEHNTVANGKNVSMVIWSLLMAERHLKFKSTHREMRLKVKIKAQDPKDPTGKVKAQELPTRNHLRARRT